MLVNAKLSRYVCEKKRIRRNTRIHELENKINLNRDEEKEIRLIFKLVRLNGKTYNQYTLKVYSNFIKIVKEVIKNECEGFKRAGNKRYLQEAQRRL